jgi:hypothetical protein
MEQNGTGFIIKEINVNRGLKCSKKQKGQDRNPAPF